MEQARLLEPNRADYRDLAGADHQDPTFLDLIKKLYCIYVYVMIIVYT